LTEDIFFCEKSVFFEKKLFSGYLTIFYPINKNNVSKLPVEAHVFAVMQKLEDAEKRKFLNIYNVLLHPMKKPLL
jgi:DNA-binding protein Fis